MSANTYCQLTDLQNILSAEGVILRSDDTPPAVLGDVIGMAGDEIDLYCWGRYTPEDLQTSDLVTKWAAALATYFLCERRGNPVPIGVAQKADRAWKSLDRVLDGTLQLPYVVPRKSFVPTVSKMRVTQRPFNRAVVEVSRSTGTPQNITQETDIYDSMGWNNQAYMNYVIVAMLYCGAPLLGLLGCVAG